MGILALAVCAFVQIFLRNAERALMVYLQGGEIIEFRPFPHLRNGQLRLSSVAWQGNFSADQVAAIKLFPMVAGTCLIIACGSAQWAGYRNPWIIALGTCALVDTVRGLLMPWWRDGGDLYTGMKALGMEPYAMPVLAGALISIWLLAFF